MGSRILRIPLDHVRQNHQETSETYVKQGDLFTNNYDNVTSGNYSYELYFTIPEDIYKYILNEYGKKNHHNRNTRTGVT